ncbi:UDP-glucuronic acid dehydrogenase [Rhodobacterales bacterium 52_120_T64]|nr:UDP-glucuronic acid dehydrogenase [Rhodobacterales bacterium 52_120_T64]
MKISILCSSRTHPVNTYLEKWIRELDPKYTVDLIRTKNDLTNGNILFLISCDEIVSLEDRARYDKTLVIHASDLPLGRGWSPHIWQIVEGATEITVSLLEAEDVVDSGDIWKKLAVHIPLNALWNEINHVIFEAELELMSFAIGQFDLVTPQTQEAAIAPTYYSRRTPKDSKLDANLSIQDQFDQIRVCDPDRYPAYFDLRGERYLVRLEKKK